VRAEMALVAQAPSRVSCYNASRWVWSRTGTAVPRVLANERNGDRQSEAGTRTDAAEATRNAPGLFSLSDADLDFDANGVSTLQKSSHSARSQSPDSEPCVIVTVKVVWWCATIAQA